jgi:signal transduction histidine kinase
MQGKISFNAVLADLDTIHSTINCGEKLLNLFNIFEGNSLPGIIVTKNSNFFGMLSKSRFYQMMSKQYRFELFSHRSIEFFLDGNNSADYLILDESTKVIEASEQALLRDDKNRYEPIIVLFINGEYKLLPAQTLLLAQNEIQTQMLGIITEANEFKKDVLRIVAHDLRNPLNVIMGFSNLIKDAANDTENVKMYSTQVLTAANSMNNLIADFLGVAINDATDFDLNFSKFDVAVCVEKVISSFNNLVLAKKQEIIFSPSETNTIVNADKNKITEVLENLISNAIKYSEFGKKIRVNVYQENNSAIIKVLDEGPGLSNTDKEKMFNKFQKLSAKPTGNETSTGLGLYIAKRIITKHEGQIWVESELGAGSAFFISLPLSH